MIKGKFWKQVCRKSLYQEPRVFSLFALRSGEIVLSAAELCLNKCLSSQLGDVIFTRKYCFTLQR